MEIAKANNVIYINNCIHCKRPIKDGWKFCPFCKAPVETFKCTFCGNQIWPGWNFCPNCKNEMKPELKNRVRIEKCNEWLRDMLKGR